MAEPARVTRPAPAARVLTCRDLARMGFDFAAPHDPHAIGPDDARCFCYAEEIHGQTLYSDIQGCRAIKRLAGAGFVVELCCGCADGWSGADEDLVGLVADSLRFHGGRRR